MKIAIGCDHIVTDTKNLVAAHLARLGYEILDKGTYNTERTHYPIYGMAVGRAVATGEADAGIVLCGTGVGISNAVNKIPGARCCLVRDMESALYARRELDANVVAFGGRISGEFLIEDVADAFFRASYDPSPENASLAARIDAVMKDINLPSDNIFDDLLEAWEQGVYHD